MIEPILVCYRLNATTNIDEESVWAYVQRCGGSLSIKSYCIDFWIPVGYASLLVCAWPELVRVESLDYI